MTKRTRQRENKQHKEQPPQKMLQLKKDITLWQKLSPIQQKIVAFLAFASSILTVVGTYYAFSPKISVTSSYSLDPSTPFSSKFDVRNDSLFNVYSIKPACTNMSVKMIGGGGTFGQGIIQTAKPSIEFLEPGETTSFTLPLSHIKYGAPIESADITVKVAYRPSLLPFKREKLAT